MRPLTMLPAPVRPHPHLLAFQLRVCPVDDGVVVVYTDRGEAVRIDRDGTVHPLPGSPWWAADPCPVPGGLVALNGRRAARWDGFEWHELPTPPLPASLIAGRVCASCVSAGRLRVLVHQSEDHHAAGFHVEVRCTALLELDLASSTWSTTISLGSALPADRLAFGPAGTWLLDGRRLVDPAVLDDDIGGPDVVGRPCTLIESVHREERELFERAGRDERLYVSDPLPDGTHLTARWMPRSGQPLVVERQEPGGVPTVVLRHVPVGDDWKSPAIFRLDVERFALVDASKGGSWIRCFNALSGAVDPVVELPGDALRGGGVLVSAGHLFVVGALVDAEDGWGILPEVHRLG